MRFRDDFALAKTLNICKLPIRIDVQVVVNVFTSHSFLIDVSHLCSILITDCKSILQHFEEAHISHIHREENLALTFWANLYCIVILIPLLCIIFYLILRVLFTLNSVSLKFILL